MARGGRRAGRPGAKYENRTDLAMNPRTAPPITGQPYGQATANAQTQQTVNAAQQARAITVDLDAPSERPDEPVTAGLPVGPGPGPEVLGSTAPSAALRSWLLTHPYDDDVREVIELLEAMGA